MSSSPALKGKPRSRSMEPAPPAMAPPAAEQQVGVACGLPKLGEPLDTLSTQHAVQVRQNWRLQGPGGLRRACNDTLMRCERIGPVPGTPACKDVMAMLPTGTSPSHAMRAPSAAPGLVVGIANGGGTAPQGPWHGWCARQCSRLGTTKTQLAHDSKNLKLPLLARPTFPWQHCFFTSLQVFKGMDVSGHNYKSPARAGMHALAKGAKLAWGAGKPS